MSDFFIENRTLTRGASLAWDIAHHIYTRQYEGTIIVATDKPLASLSAVKKKWLSIERQVQVEVARTLNARRIRELRNTLAHMQHMSFTLDPETETLDFGRVLFMTPNEMAARSISCGTIYVATQLGPKQLETIKGMLKPESALIIYSDT